MHYHKDTCDGHWGLWYDFVMGSYRRFSGGESVESVGGSRSAVRDRVLGLSGVVSCYAQTEIAAWDKTDEMREFFEANSAELGLGEYRLEFCVSNRLADDELAVVDGDWASEVVSCSDGAVSVFGMDSEWNMAVKFKKSCGSSRAMSGCFAFAPMAVYEGCGISGIGKNHEGDRCDGGKAESTQCGISGVDKNHEGGVVRRAGGSSGQMFEKLAGMLAEEGVGWMPIGVIAERLRGSPVFAARTEIAVSAAEAGCAGIRDIVDGFLLADGYVFASEHGLPEGSVVHYGKGAETVSVLFAGESCFSGLVGGADTVEVCGMDVNVPSLADLRSIRETYIRDELFPVEAIRVLEYMLGMRASGPRTVSGAGLDGVADAMNGSVEFHPLAFFDCDYHRLISRNLKLSPESRIFPPSLNCG